MIPAVEKSVFGRRIVITPRIEKSVKYKDGDWHRYTAEADELRENLKFEIVEFRKLERDEASFTVKVRAKLKIRGDVAFYRLDVGAEIPVGGSADLVLLLDCRAKLKPRDGSKDVSLEVLPRKVEIPRIVMTKLGPLKGDEARKAGDLLRGLFADDFKKKQDEIVGPGQRSDFARRHARPRVESDPRRVRPG